MNILCPTSMDVLLNSAPVIGPSKKQMSYAVTALMLMVWMVSTSLTRSAPVSPTHIVTDCAWPEMLFVICRTRPERNVWAVVMTSTPLAIRLPSA